MQSYNINNVQEEISRANYPSFSERLRPRTFNELLIPETGIAKFNKMTTTLNIPNMIFYGPPGTGKTTCAHLIGNSLNIEMLYVNAAEVKDSQHLKRKIEGYVTALSLFTGSKIVLLDESDCLPKNAQEVLRGIIDRSISNCRFILTANDLPKIQNPLRSRCRPFSFEVTYSSLDASITKLTNMIQSRLEEMDVRIDKSLIHQIVVMKFPDYRAIANEIEFEFM